MSINIQPGPPVGPAPATPAVSLRRSFTQSTERLAFIASRTFRSADRACSKVEVTWPPPGYLGCQLLMNTSAFESQLPEFQSLLNVTAARRRYSDRHFWDSVGSHELDLALSRLADFYAGCNDGQRRILRRSLHPAASWNLVAYVRRMALQILSTKDASWLTRAMNIASLENATIDFRDSIASLVIARIAAENVGIDPLPHFDKAISKCDSSMISTFKNARDHRPSNVSAILRFFGPPQLKPKRKKQIG